MSDLRQFLIRLAEQAPSGLDQAIALLWYYERTERYDERTAIGLAEDIAKEGFGRQNASQLKARLARSSKTVKGTRAGTFRINGSAFPDLTRKYGPLIDPKTARVASPVIPPDYVSDSRVYFVRLVEQINGCYDAGFLDAFAVLLRRLVESLIIEIYIRGRRAEDIKEDDVFLQLNSLAKVLSRDREIHPSRGLMNGINTIKDIGNTAAHDRTYMTPLQDIDENRILIRKTVSELLTLSELKS